jgi:mono/diheme cytochrome c family protein
MKYTANVLPIIQANCYSCHANGQINGGVTLDSYTKVKAQVDNGNLIGVITHAAGYPAMPYNLPKLSECDINKIKDWIARGAQNN